MSPMKSCVPWQAVIWIVDYVLIWWAAFVEVVVGSMMCDLISILQHAYPPSFTNVEVPLLHKNSICIQIPLTCKICDVYHFSLSPRHHSSGMISSSLNDCIIITPNKWPWLIAYLLDMGLRAILRHKRTWCTVKYWKDTLYQTCKALDKDRIQHNMRIWPVSPFWQAGFPSAFEAAPWHAQTFEDPVQRQGYVVSSEWKVLQQTGTQALPQVCPQLWWLLWWLLMALDKQAVREATHY